MNERKFTNKEIKKALECCIFGDCQGCLYGDTDQRHCKDDLMRNALDLINRQQAEIDGFRNRQKPTAASGYKIENGKVVFFTDMFDGYRHEYETLDEIVKTLNELLQECYIKDELVLALKTAKAEAIKEFAERLKGEMSGRHCMYFNYEITNVIVDNLVKEMAGDAE